MAKTAEKKKAKGGAPDFEESLARLERIVETLDEGNLPLEKSLGLFKEGTKLARSCRELLAEAEVQVKEALRDVGSARVPAPGTPDPDEDDDDDEDEEGELEETDDDELDDESEDSDDDEEGG